MGDYSHHNQETTRLMKLFKEIPLLKGLNGPIIWIDVDAPYDKHKFTHSLSNEGELKTTRIVACQMGDIVGDTLIAIIVPYSQQVSQISARSKRLHKLIIQSFVERRNTPGLQ
jgi:hypothetical protein